MTVVNQNMNVGVNIKRTADNQRNIIPITDFDAPQLDVYARLTEVQLLNRHEPEKGIFIAESPRVIERALDYGCIPVSILIETRQIERILLRGVVIFPFIQQSLMY